MDKNIRCIVCRTLFSLDELKEKDSCPICGYVGLTMTTFGDVNININVLELKILCSWAEQLALEGADQHSLNAFYSIVNAIKEQLPKSAGNLTTYESPILAVSRHSNTHKIHVLSAHIMRSCIDPLSKRRS